MLGTPSIIAKTDNIEAILSVQTNQMAAKYFPNAYVDIEKVDGLVNVSPLDWTVVRYLNPNMEDDGNGLGYTLDSEKAKAEVSRHNIAKFIIDYSITDEYIKKSL